MNSSSRRRAAVYVMPMIITLVAAQRLASAMRTVDFLLVCSAGAVFGVTLFGLIQVLRMRGEPAGSASPGVGS